MNLFQILAIGSLAIVMIGELVRLGQGRISAGGWLVRNTIWLAGGGVKPGMAYGATDAVGLRAAEQPVHIRNFHATLLHLLGLDHEALSYFHNGLDERLIGPTDDVEVVRGILA